MWGEKHAIKAGSSPNMASSSQVIPSTHLVISVNLTGCLLGPDGDYFSCFLIVLAFKTVTLVGRAESTSIGESQLILIRTQSIQPQGDADQESSLGPRPPGSGAYSPGVSISGQLLLRSSLDHTPVGLGTRP